MMITELKELLEERAEFYNKPEFIETDPIQIPHYFSQQRDIEISGFLTATLSWGQRKTIIRKSRELMSLMDNSPYNFILSATGSDFKRFERFCHRTFNTTDTLYFLNSLKNIYQHHGGLSKLFAKGFAVQKSAKAALTYFRRVFLEPEYPLRTIKHVSDVSKGSSAKRLNMFLRWMVRNDKKGVDFGLWDDINPSWLSIPLDLHTGRTARQLGLLKRKQDDWKAVEELTSELRKFDPSDPVKYDFALFGMGAFEKS
jgi:uncharacterized protein (TIGR02757 family)